MPEQVESNPPCPQENTTCHFHLGPALMLLLLMLAAVYCGYRAFAPRPYRWAVGTVLVLWFFLLTTACLVVSSTIHLRRAPNGPGAI